MNAFDKSMREVGEKINFARNTLQGPNKRIRDDQGFSYTTDRILTSIGNFYDMSSTRYTPISEAIARGLAQASRSRNFSATDLASVRDVDVADIAIASTVASHGLTYIAMERAMDSVAQQITFQGLRAMNSAGGFSAGSKVIDPRSSINPVVDFSRNGARPVISVTLSGTSSATSAAAVTLTVNAVEDASHNLVPTPVVLGETKIMFSATAAGTKELLAFDTGKVQPDASGNVPLVLCKGGLISEASVNLNTGVLTLKAIDNLSAGAMDAVFCIDRIAEGDGAHTLKLKPYMESTELVSTENRVILQTSVEVQAQMNKILRKNAQYGVNVDFGKRAIDQVIQLYTYFIDLNIVRALWEGVSAKYAAPDVSLNLSGYSADYKTFAATKNDRIGQFVDTMGAKFVSRTGSPMTAMIVNEQAGLMLSSDKESFVPDEAIFSRRDGLIGTYRGTPVIRNAYLNDKGTGVDSSNPVSTSNPARGVVIGVFKSPDGTCGPVAQGDYLPPYSTLPAINSNNPGELSQALFSQTATKCVVPEWAIRGEITQFDNSGSI